MKRNQVMANKYALSKASRRKPRRYGFRTNSMVYRIIKEVLAKEKKPVLTRDARRFRHAAERVSCGRNIRQRVPRRSYHVGYPWRLWAWHCSGRSFGFEPVRHG